MVRLGSGIAALGLLGAAACVIVHHQRVDVEPVDARREPLTIETPVKAHLLDGSTIVFPIGVSLSADTIRGRSASGMRYSLTLRDSAPAGLVPLDSVVGMENYITRTNEGTSLILTTLASAGATALTAAATVAIFGSCPTLYADSAGTPVLQAEIFANRVSPLFEARDIDRLSAAADGRGAVRLEVRNEALETHYINHLELLEVRHAADERVVPDERGRPLALRGLGGAAARDRAGRDLGTTLAAVDGDVFETDDSLLAAASAEDPRDYIDITAPRPAGSDSVAIVLDLRNSLLNTVLFYDMMLGEPGLRSLDWLAHDMTRIGPVLSLGRWYNSRFGLRVQVRGRDGSYRQVARHPTYGPIAWREVASVVPVSSGEDSVHIRLSFIADEWRIERVRVAAQVRRARERTVPAAAATDRDGAPLADALAHLRKADERYLQTSPGQRLEVRFDAGAPPAGDSARTFLLASQGYYTEWVRGRWIKRSTRNAPFAPGDSALVATIRRWRAHKDSIGRQFYATRIPVR